MGQTAQDAREDAQKLLGHSEAINDAQLIRGVDDDFAGYFWIRECTPEFASAFREKGENVSWTVNGAGMIALVDE